MFRVSYAASEESRPSGLSALYPKSGPGLSAILYVQRGRLFVRLCHQIVLLSRVGNGQNRPVAQSSLNCREHSHSRQVLLSCRQVGLTEATENARSNPMTAQWLPKGFHTITPNIVADDAEGAVTYDPEVASWDGCCRARGSCWRRVISPLHSYTAPHNIEHGLQLPAMVRSGLGIRSHHHAAGP
jgi:hypothetical protein